MSKPEPARYRTTNWSAYNAHEVPASERDASLSLADRLRAAAQGIDREALAERAKALQQERQAEEREAEANA